MQKKKVKEKRLRHRLTLWLSVLFLGLLVGISIQFTRAWVEPSSTVTAPDGNIAAPINTGPVKQTKVGDATHKADICVDPYGSGDEKCLSDQVSWPKCTLDGGMPVIVDGVTMCKFPGATCGAGWKSHLYYSETTANTCTGGGSCGTSVTSPSHKFSNVDPSTETAVYYDGNGQTIYCTGGCINNCGCWCNGYCCPCTCCCGWATYPCGSTCTSTAKACTSTQTAIGCVLI